MKILVTGSSGFIGGSICIQAKALNHYVIGVDRHKRDYLLPYIDDFAHGDFCDDYFYHYLKEVKPDVVIHCAGYIRVDESIANPSKYYNNNVYKSIKLLDLIRDKCPDTHFMFSSTGSVYKAGNSLTESSPTQPITPYSRSKLMMESIIQDYAAAYNLKYTIFRYFNACGAFGTTHGQLPRSPHLLARLFEDETISLYGFDYPTVDGSCIRDYVHVRDIVSAHMFAMDKNLTGVYNIGQGRGFTTNQIIDEYRIRVKDKTINYCPRRPGDPTELVSSVDLIKQKGWASENYLFEIFQDLKLWYQSENFKGLVDGKVYFN